MTPPTTQHPLSPCPGCGGLFRAYDGPVHRYMTGSPACWNEYGRLLAMEYSSAVLMWVHRLSVDAYAVQHPGDNSRQAIQSVGIHLARLMVQLDGDGDPSLSPEKTNAVMVGFTKHKASLVHLERPARFSITMADMTAHVGTPDHAPKVIEWARAALADWSAHHDYIRDWAGLR